MRDLKLLFALPMLLGGLWVGNPLHGEDWLFTPIRGNQDVLLFNDEPNSHSLISAVGDYDGDGAKDLLFLASNFVSSSLYDWELLFFRGPTWNNNARFSQEVDMRIHLPTSAQFPAPQPFLIDLTGDKRDELVIRLSSAIYVFQGNTEVPPSLDLSEADLKILGPLAGDALSVGDLDQDGLGELVISYSFPSDPARTEWHIIEGNAGFLNNPIDSGLNAVKKIIGPYSMGTVPEMMDINGDTWKDIVLTNISTTTTEVQVLWGKQNFPTTWDLQTSSADMKISVSDWFITPASFFCGDLTGDHRSEMLAFSTGPNHPFLFDGAGLTAGTNHIGGIPGEPGYLPPVPALSPINLLSSYLASEGDFDGDGRSDLVFDSTSYIYALYILLSSDISPGPLLESTSPSLVINDPNFQNSARLSDINNDGVDDLISYSPFNSIPGVYGGLFIVYGHRLMRNPSVDIRPRAIPSPHVALALSVEGDPVDMMISGDITDTFRDQWIPFASTLDVTLSSPEGAKQVKAKFRNALGRVSAEALDTLTLAAPTPQVLPFTNWVGNHGEVRAQFDCSLPTAGRVRAWVLDPRGVEIKELMSADQTAGIVTVEWDGTNGSGRKVSRGVYYVVIDSHGRSQHRVIVE